MSAPPATSAPTALLHDVGVKALAWLDANREHFRARLDDDTPDEEVKDRFKPIGELAAIGRVLFREGAAGSRQTKLVSGLLDFAWHELLDSGALLTWMQRQEPLSPIPFEIYVPFRELGYTDPAVERHAATVHGLRSGRVLGMPPARRLGLSVNEQRAGLTPGTPVPQALERTWLAATPEPWTVQSHIAYDITHTVFHLTRWGEDPDGLPPDVADYLALWLPAWLDDWAAMEHWDLLGELLVVEACLPAPALHAEPWERFAAAQREDGAMPAQREMPTGSESEVFDLVHHPTLVAAFASVMATSRALSALTGDGNR